MKLTCLGLRAMLFSALFFSATALGQVPKLRLSEVQDVQPVSYRMDLSLYPAKDDFSGSVEIQLQVNRPTETLWLNATSIAVQNVSLTAGSKTLRAAIINGDSKSAQDFIGFKFDQSLPSGHANLRVDYTGKFLLSDQAGIFRTEDSGNRYLLTQFEQTDARRAFPCFDEPLYKVPWQLTLHVPSTDSAVSNTPVISKSSSQGKTTYVFAQTKPLPSYLVAFGVGPFEYVDAGFAGKKHVPVRIVTPKGRAAEAKYAAEVTATILTRLEDYFGVPYPYEKSDQVAIPVSASFAMENAGMVTYGQTSILSKAASDTEARRRGYAEVAAHELAHQWFGDLVTTAWWDDIWLNEAFATWMSSKLIAEWKPEWGTRAEDVDAKLYAEDKDSLLSARKIRQEIKSNDDINNAFDGITYQKGAAVIGMFENWIGSDSFRSGVQAYMKRYAFRTATTGDFLDSLSTASSKNVNGSFSTFLNQSGLPVVSVALDCSHKEPSLHLEQKRYIPLGSKSDETQLWSLPVCVRYGGEATDQRQCTLLSKAAEDVHLNARNCPSWVQANDGAVGYYRVNYVGDLLEKLTAGDITKRLVAAERVDLLGDVQGLTNSGTLDESRAMNLAAVFHSDPERHVVERSVRLITDAGNHLVPDDLDPKYAEFVRSNFQARARELGWVPKAGESDDVRLLRPVLLSAVATKGADQELAKEARSLTDQWFEDSTKIDPTVTAEVLSTTAYYGDNGLAERLISQWNKLDAQQQLALVIALFSFRDTQAVNTLLNAVLSEKLPATPASYLYFYIGRSSPASRGARLAFLKDHFEAVLKQLPEGPFASKSQLPLVGSGFCDASSKNDLNAFFAPRLDQLTGAPRTLAQVLEGIDQCIALKSAQEPSMVTFLKSR